MKKILFLFLIALMIGLSSTAMAEDTPRIFDRIPPLPGDERVECSVTIPIDKNEITITVSSNGCTDKTYFRFEIVGPVERSDKLSHTSTVERPKVRFIRIKRDDCKMMDHEIKLTYSFAELGIKPN